MRTVTKKELTDRIAHSLNEKRSTVKNVIQRFLDDISSELSQGNRLEFRDFGVFGVRVRKPRMARNPRTSEQVPVPYKCTVKFKVGRELKDRVQQGTAELRSTATKVDRRGATAATSESPPSPAN
jgi:integration host factor subunit beta